MKTTLRQAGTVVPCFPGVMFRETVGDLGLVLALGAVHRHGRQDRQAVEGTIGVKNHVDTVDMSPPRVDET